MLAITPILTAPDRDESRGEELLPLVYGDLRRLAAFQLAQERPGQTLQATALVHEAWLRLAGVTAQNWEDRQHLFRVVARAMRRILVEKARRKSRVKHGSDLQRVDLAAMDLPTPMPDDRMLALDAALNKLVQVNPEGAELVQLCFFG
jgi:RNA polymerase sigma factor (TIGR02999 family)